ncbi:unnamed protein product [Leptidea sinapis]|uniref:Uncharacterized protein n=1 Tax=Leptidea sinapis TaxID=189913 RepID=A0A5E4PQY0_9NEOP|nr:unnamed protein product [Leptidea sinapis]
MWRVGRCRGAVRGSGRHLVARCDVVCHGDGSSALVCVQRVRTAASYTCRPAHLPVAPDRIFIPEEATFQDARERSRA